MPRARQRLGYLLNNAVSSAGAKTYADVVATPALASQQPRSGGLRNVRFCPLRREVRSAMAYPTRLPFGRTTRQTPPNSVTFWQRICAGRLSPM